MRSRFVIIACLRRVFYHRHRGEVLAVLADGRASNNDDTGGSSWVGLGELIALRPRHIDFLRRQVTVEETIIEVSKRYSPTGERMIVKPYPKDNEARTFGVREQWLQAIASTSRVAASAGTSSSSPPKPVRRSHATPPERACGFRRLGPRVLISTSVCTTFATHMRLGCSPAAPT